MSTAAINSASAHRQLSKNLESKKVGGAISRTSKMQGGPCGTTVMQSLFNDESILSSHATAN